MLTRFLWWLISKLQAREGFATGPVFVVDATLKVPKIYHGPLDEESAKEFCPSQNNMSPAIIRYGARGPEVVFEWDAVNLAWRKPRKVEQ